MIDRIARVVPDALDGLRLDRVLAQLIEETSRSELARWIEAGRVTVDDRVILRASEKIRRGAHLVARPMPPPASDARPDASVVFGVVYEDDALIVVDKPAGLVVHPAKGHQEGTLVHGLLARGPLAEPEATGPPRPGIVHRIDKDTSGLLVVARTARAREHLKEQFAKKTIERVYDAIAVGPLPDRLTIDTPYGRHPTDRKAFTSRLPPGAGKRAITHVQVIERFAGGAVARIECRLETGRTHQIRVHLADKGAPLLGDTKYGTGPRRMSGGVYAIGQTLGRQALHARVLGFVHPISGKLLRFEAPWPEDFARAIAALRRA